MALVRPSRPQYKPEEDLTVAGQYYARCTRVEQGLPNKSFPGGRPQVVIEFTVGGDCAADLKGKKCAIVCTESIYRDPVTKRESHFLQHCRMMGAQSPEQGVDPETFMGKYYWVRVEESGGKCYVRAAMPAAAPTPKGRPPAPVEMAVASPDDQGDNLPPF